MRLASRSFSGIPLSIFSSALSNTPSVFLEALSLVVPVLLLLLILLIILGSAYAMNAMSIQMTVATGIARK